MVDYQKKNFTEKTNKLREILNELPTFCSSFFMAMEGRSTILSRVNYAHDLRIFFQYLNTQTLTFKGKTIGEYTVHDLEKISIDDMYNFMNYLDSYENSKNMIKENGLQGKARKIACLRSFFNYYFRKQLISQNLSSFLDTPKLQEKPIVLLDHDEIKIILNAIESGEMLTEKQKQ